MERIDNSRFLLYIEPNKEEKSKEPINDEITEIMELALSESESGASNYSRIGEDEFFRKNDGFMGTHLTDCGERSTNKDYLLKNGMITNSLCVFYLKHYRNSIPKSEIDKVMQLVEFYKNKTNKWFKMEQIETSVGSNEDMTIEQLKSCRKKLIILHECGNDKKALIGQLETMILGLKNDFNGFSS